MEWLSALKTQDVNNAAKIFKSSHELKEFLLNGAILCYEGNQIGNTKPFMNTKDDMIFCTTDITNKKRYGETMICIQDLLTYVEEKQLILVENSFSLRSLEFATFHGCLEIPWRILKTHIGYNVIQYFDMSDYELFDEDIPQRLYCSPMDILMFLDTSWVQAYHAHYIVNDVLSNEAINAKWWMNWPFICVWSLVRVFT